MVFLPLEWKWRIVPHKAGDLGLPGIHFSILNSIRRVPLPLRSTAVTTHSLMTLRNSSLNGCINVHCMSMEDLSVDINGKINNKSLVYAKVETL